MDAQLLQAKYRVVLPALDQQELRSYGRHIEQECKSKNTYRLSQDDKPHGEKQLKGVG